MKDLIRTSKKVFKVLTAGFEVERLLPDFITASVENPDAELGISVDILNELLNQNFPLETSVPISGDKQVDISVAAAEIHMKPHHEVELRITNAAIQYDQTIFKIGLQSNVVAVSLQLGIVKKDSDFYLVAHGSFPEFHIKYLPKWVETRLAEVLTSKLLSPLINFKIDDLLTLNKEFKTDFVTFKLALKPETAGVKVTEKGISLQVRFQKLVQ